MVDEPNRPNSTLPRALLSRNPLAWLTLFGPGAIVASLTIGTGELIFSSRGGAIFGYRILLLFVVICVLKWCLVFSTARHMVLSGAHPFQRWMELPAGPRGWLPSLLFFFAAICIPVWVSFHAGVLGNLMASVTGTRGQLGGGVDQLWGGLILSGMLVLALTGGYRALERVQLAIVLLLLLAVIAALILMRPDWWELARGAILPQSLHYPAWLLNDARPEYRAIVARPVWVETTLYVGVIGGASYDYLAYTSFLRDKRWGQAGQGIAPPDVLQAIAEDPRHPVRRWVRAVLFDCTLSFVVVLVFTAVFVALGALVLGPRQQIPGNQNFLEHQAQFVTQLHPWLYPLYVAGALLTMLGTLYGTLEVAPTVLREMMRSVWSQVDPTVERRWRRLAIAWCGVGALAILTASFLQRVGGEAGRFPGMIAILTPANLFTGVLSCGLICLLNPWVDVHFLPRSLRMPARLVLLNLLAGSVFVALGLKGYWDYGRWRALGILVLTIGAGFLAAAATRLYRRGR